LLVGARGEQFERAAAVLKIQYEGVESSSVVEFSGQAS
jgi:hypothetical protein